jgi:uncharacterized repeat protein (TIGR01451 family)
LVLALSAFASQPAQAQDCSDYGGVLDGAAGDIAPSQLQIDQNCTIRNYPASNPINTNFSFFTQPGQNPDRWLLVFDNVVHTGQMSCATVLDHTVWFVNGASSAVQQGCYNLLIPVEKIEKQNPAGQTTASIGVPFTYTLTSPVLYDSGTGTVINNQGSLNDLHSVVLTDDLNASGADLDYVSHVAYWESSGLPVPHNFSNVGGLLTFDGFPIVPAGEQIIIELTVVLADSPANSVGTQFINIAEWEFGRLIDGVFYEPLPGENGISEPLTIAAPELVMTKTGPATLGLTLNLGQWGQFGLNLQNTGLSDAWNVTLVDRLPDGPTGGMCSLTPQILTAQVFAADGASTVPGKGPLVAGADYTLNFNGAPQCELTLTMLTAAAAIGPGERLIITYQTQLDPNTQDGVDLTNIAGATEWFNGDASNPDRVRFARPVTTGTPTQVDHQDAHTVTAALFGYFFEKTVANLTSGVSPAATAAPGDTLRYTLRLQATDVALTNIEFYDDLGALNPTAVFVPGSLALVPGSLPPGADASTTSPSGGTNGAGIIDVRNLSVPVGSSISLQFDITLDGNVPDGTVVLNQADLISSSVMIADSDDPNVNGQADPSVAGDEDPTQIVVDATPPVLRFEKTVANVTAGVAPAATATPGDTLRYSLYVEAVTDVNVVDFRIVDELDALNSPAAFVPGSMALVTVPAGADTSNTSATGGADGTGLIDVRGLNLNGAGDSVLIEFEVTLPAVMPNGALVLNQSQLLAGNLQPGLSDDPNVNGQSDPYVPGDEDPTQIQVQSAPYFDVDKISAYVDGDPTVLLAGETLRYTITVKNIGTADAVDAMLRDEVPANTTYVAGSTTLNGAAVPDPSPGVLPLSNGISINAPEDTTPGAIRADASATTSNVATIVFFVIVDPSVIDGTIISNQGFVSAVAGGVADQPSDDPRTDVIDDPTRDVVGTLPLIYAEKSAALQVDLGTPGVVDPGDTLRYTITIYNNGAVPATEVALIDAVPANTTYVTDTTTLNGMPVGQPDNGVSPLAAGIPVSSSDLTPPLPATGAGTLSAGESAVVQFDLLVDAGVAPGTLITNQAVVASYEVADVLTDGDGNPATGPEPTVVIVGDQQQLSITKQVAVVGGGPAVAGATLEYTVRVVNISTVPASYVVITDDLDMPVPAQLQYVAQSATMNGSQNGIAFAAPVLTADYSSVYGALDPGAEIILRFRAMLYSNLPIGTVVTNEAVVSWNDPPQTETATVSITVGGVPGVGILNGTAWHDANFDNVLDSGERTLDGWTVQLYRDTDLIHTTLTAADGTYRISGVVPNYLTTDQYELRFVAPGAAPSTALLGLADSAFTDYLQRIEDIVVASGDNLQDLNMPIDPDGVVYNSESRTPIAGAVLRLMSATSGATLPAACFDDTAQQGQVSLADGYYKFDLNFSDPSCPTGGDYLIDVTAPGATYVTGSSQLIPPSSDSSTLPLSVPLCPGSPQDAIPVTAQYCEAQPSEFAPPSSIQARSNGTEYYLHLTFDDSQPPGSAQIFNNHIPLDPVLNDAVSISKTTPMLSVSRGQLVPYTITVDSEVDFDLQNLTIADRFPPGFRYVSGSARINGVPAEPTVNGRELLWSNLGLTGAGRNELQLLLAVGAGISEGEYVNRAQAIHSITGNVLSGEATATVRLVPDPNFDCTDVMGKVYDDSNRNGIQDLDERGIGGVRLVTARGLSTTTDQYGRFHITCAIVPREGRGSNFILKLDDRTLPSGFRASTTPVQMERATRGKTLRFSFGASIHRVVGLDIADPVFEPGMTDLRPQWRPRVNLLLEELQKGPAILRLSYLADVEDPQLVEDRVEAIKTRILSDWDPLQHGYELVVEPEVFWRRGGPPERSPMTGAER